MKPHSWSSRRASWEHPDSGQSRWVIHTCQVCGAEIATYGSQSINEIADRKQLVDCDERIVSQIHND